MCQSVWEKLCGTFCADRYGECRRLMYNVTRMEKYDVIIVGGGISGLSCALILGSSEGRGPWTLNRKILVIDNGRSDALGARYNNAAGVTQETLGKDALEVIRGQLERYKIVTREKGTVTNVKEGGGFEVSTEEGANFQGDILVLATGFHFFKITGLKVEVVKNKKSYMENKVQIVNDHFRVRDRLYVAGMLAGVSSQFSVAAGSGAQVACDIMMQWAGTNVVVHDKP